MKFAIISVGILLFAFSLSFPAPAAAQNYEPNGTCGVGGYWLIHDNGWDGVLIRQGDTNTFKAFGAFWQQPDGTATYTIDLQGDKVIMDRVDDPNPLGGITCHYEGNVRADGTSAVGNNTCVLTSGTSRALSWTAIIVCYAPIASWYDTAFWHRAAKGQQFNFVCPPNGFAAPVWGTDTYIEGSSVCTAGVHAGAITMADGGLVTIEILPGLLEYPGSTRNGITSETFPTAGQFNASFRVVGGQDTGNGMATATPDTTGVGHDSVLGVWNTDFGVITIATDGYGTYSDHGEPSHITFTYNDAHTIDGFWVEQSSAQECASERDGSRHWGRLHITFDAAFNSYSGLWGYCDDDPNIGWRGTRADQ